MEIATNNLKSKNKTFWKLSILGFAIGILGISFFPSLVQPVEKSTGSIGEAAFFRLEAQIVNGN